MFYFAIFITVFQLSVQCVSVCFAKLYFAFFLLYPLRHLITSIYSFRNPQLAFACLSLHHHHRHFNFFLTLSIYIYIYIILCMSRLVTVNITFRIMFIACSCYCSPLFLIDTIVGPHVAVAVIVIVLVCDDAQAKAKAKWIDLEMCVWLCGGYR